MTTSATKEELQGYPPLLVMVAGRDPLRDEGADFYHKAREAGVDTELAVFEKTIHAFFGR